MAGYYENYDFSTHGFVLRLPPSGGSISYNYLDASDATTFAGINNSLLISGQYRDSYLVNSFIAQLVR